MNPKDSKPKPAGDSSQCPAQVDGAEKKDQHAPARRKSTLTEQAAARMDEAHVRTEQADLQVGKRLSISLKEIHDLKAALDAHAIVTITDPEGRITYVTMVSI
jgi:hypothetical protein